MNKQDHNKNSLLYKLVAEINLIILYVSSFIGINNSSSVSVDHADESNVDHIDNTEKSTSPSEYSSHDNKPKESSSVISIIIKIGVFLGSIKAIIEYLGGHIKDDVFYYRLLACLLLIGFTSIIDGIKTIANRILLLIAVCEEIRNNTH